nr:MAG TPA: hypothetical protein [Caudoviricetes sp.]
MLSFRPLKKWGRVHEKSPQKLLTYAIAFAIIKA